MAFARAMEGGMPLDERDSYSLISVRMARVLTRLADPRTRAEIASDLGLAVSTVRDDIRRVQSATRTHNQREAARWWMEHRARWARWLLDDLGVDPREVPA